uniref:Unkown protein n=1 Tax=Riptortus pedestris TaxID=329032 RepID=R4WE88_RIPPE|nr:unkown protein [Riptortus pedestris]
MNCQINYVFVSMYTYLLYITLMYSVTISLYIYLSGFYIYLCITFFLFIGFLLKPFAFNYIFQYLNFDFIL